MSRTINNVSFRSRCKATQLSHGISFGLRYSSELCNMQKIEKLGKLLNSKRKENMVRQNFDLKKVLKTARRLEKKGESDEVVKDLISAFQEVEVTDISFSSIEVKDIHLLEINTGGYLIFKDEIALKPSELFEGLMERIFRRWNLSLERARRTIVDAYLLEAVDHEYDPKTYDIKKDKLAIYPEYYVDPLIIESVQRNLVLNGSIDYISAERAELHNLSLQIGKSLPSHCVFCAVEAKKDESFAQGSGELLGEMKALHKREKKPINGVLTDGLRWMFYHLDNDNYYESKVIHHETHSNVILGALHYWVRGEIPAENLLEKVDLID